MSDEVQGLKLLIISKSFLPVPGARMLATPAVRECTRCEANLRTVEHMKSDVAKREAARVDNWNSLRSELESRLAEAQEDHSRRMMEAVMEVEGHKSRAARAERERDALQFQLQEMERRHRAERDEEQGIRETLNSRLIEFERRTNIVELQRARAETEASSARQQLEHWRSAARAAQDEVASLRAECEQLRSSAGRHSSRSMEAGRLPVAGSASPPSNYGIVRPQARTVAKPDPPSPPAKTPADRAAVEDRLRLIEAEARRLGEQLDDSGQAKTLKARLEREQLRRRIQELRNEASLIRGEAGGGAQHQ